MTEKEYKKIFEEYLSAVLNGLGDGLLEQAMKYVLSAGGKRVRPVLTLAVANCLGVPFKKVLPFACSLEIIHNSSLVHDDLPCIDNDDYRRGRLSCHKKFGESAAVLCGDALQNFAYEHSLNAIKDLSGVKCMELISRYSGFRGMLGGQFKDVYAEKNKIVNKELLEEIEIKKTAKLIMASVLIPTFFVEKNYFSELKEYAENVGVVFQIVDDVLDVKGDKNLLGKTLGKDSENGKLTSVEIYGLSECERLVQEKTQKAVSALKNVENSEFLENFAVELSKRIY